MIRLLLLAAALLLLPAVATAADRDAALEKVYEAADAIDAARAEQEAERPDEAVRLLADAEGHLAAARALDPDVPRIGYELARIRVLQGDEKAAAEALTPALKLPMPLEQHLSMVALLDGIRARQGQPPLGVAWQRAQDLRGAGIATLVGGLAATAAGLAVAYTSFEGAATDGVTDEALATNRGGWALCGVGGAATAAGLGLTAAGQVQVSLLQGVLPGPWRLAGGERSTPSLYAGLLVSGTFPPGAP
jgi:hypothetical protein